MPARPIRSFSHGFFAPFSAGSFLRRHPSLTRFIIIPFLINITVLGLAVYFGLYLFEHRIIEMVPQGNAWYWAFLTYFLWGLAVLLTMVLVFFSFTVVGSIIASPFNDLLSERTEEIVSGRRSDEPFSLSVFLGDARRTIIDETRKVLLFVAAMAVLLLFNLLPGLGTLIYSVCSVLLTIFFLVVEYTGYVFTRKHLSFSSQRRYIQRHLLLMSGFGTGILCLLAIPFLQFFCIPLGVIGATRLYLETGNKEEIG